MTDVKRPTPSLLEPESRGGDVAEGGFSFQANVVAAWIPKWLSFDGFESMIREATGDTEAKFFVPGRGNVLEFVEVKNHPLTLTEFWAEIDRFRVVDSGSPGTYGWFTLVSTGLSESLRPLINGLRRVRGGYGFYDVSHKIWTNSFGDYAKLVIAMGRSKEEAAFLFEKVLIVPDFGTAFGNGEALFRQGVADHIPWASDSAKAVGAMYQSISALVVSRRNETIYRSELEKIIRSISGVDGWAGRSVTIHTAKDEQPVPQTALSFQWSCFFGGTDRCYPGAQAWNDHLMADLKAARSWIQQHRLEREIRLTGDRRLSAAMALGSVFSAVAGFHICMEARGAVWRTDSYASGTTDPYRIDVQPILHGHSDLVVTVGILKDIKAEVVQFLGTQGLSSCPLINIYGGNGVSSGEQADLIVRGVKAEVAEALRLTGAGRVHLFFAGPSFLALRLGHQLNATRPIQCYEWVGPGSYAPTCTLETW